MDNKKFYVGTALLLVVIGPASYFGYEAYKDGNNTILEKERIQRETELAVEKERRQTELAVEQARRETEKALEEERTKRTDKRWDEFGDAVKKSWFRNPFIGEGEEE